MLAVAQTDTLMTQLQHKLESLALEQLARQTKFVQRTPKKITPLNFVLGLIHIVLTGGCALSSIASTIGLMADQLLSKQAVAERITEAAVKFLEDVLAATLAQHLGAKTPALHPQLAAAFPRVLVRDSTTLTLDASLAEDFPGSRNQTQQETAIVRIQGVFDLVSQAFCSFALTAYTRNDQAAAEDILLLVQPADCVVQDLGFFSLPALRKIADKGAYFLSRWKFGTLLFRADGQTPINLLKALQKHGQLDIRVCVGADEKLPARLVARRLPEAVAAERRRKAKANRDRRCTLSKPYLALLAWEIFLTNIPRAVLTAEQISNLYDLRWRIEIMFKAWKSHFNLRNVPVASAVRVKSHIYAMLIFITLFQTEVYRSLSDTHAMTSDRPLSLLKLAQFFTEQFWAIVSQPPATVLKHIFYHCVYERRNDRRNHVQKMSILT